MKQRTDVLSSTFQWDVEEYRKKSFRKDSSASIAYGILQDVGVDTKDLSPHEAWELVNELSGKDKRVREKLSKAQGGKSSAETNKKKSLHHMDIPGAKELYERLSKGDFLSPSELRNHPAVKELERRAKETNDMYGDTSTINSPDREQLRDEIERDFMARGSMEERDGKWKTTGDVKNGFYAEIVLGLPAAGKSSIITKDSKELGAFVFDADWIKEQLPEFIETDGLAASAVHAESTKIRDDAFSEFLHGKRKGDNLILETIGRDPSWLYGENGQLRLLEQAGYHVKIRLMDTDVTTCMNRSVKRAFETGRYVSIENIYECGSKPVETYRYFAERKNRWGESYV